MNEIVYRGESNQPLTNSLLVAAVFEKEHKHVREAIKKLLTTAENSTVHQMFAESTYLNEQNKEQPMFIMNLDGFTLLAMGFNGKKAMAFKLKYIEAFNAMRRQIECQKPSLPQNYLEALKAMVKIEEQKQQLALENHKQQEQIADISRENVELGNKITEMLPKVSYYDRILESKSTMTVTQIAQDYGMSAVKMNRILSQLKIQRKVQGQWILYNNYVPCGYVHSKAVDIVRADGRRDVKYNTEWTVKGRIFLYNKLKESGIIPLIEQDIKKENQPVQQTLNL